MKTKFLALLIALMVMPFLSACGDDDDSINPNKFGTASLQSSQWTGTLTKKYDVGTVQKDRVANCGIIFDSKRGGEFSCQWTDTYEKVEKVAFSYKISGKSIIFTSTDNILTGEYIVLEYSASKMRLTKGTGSFGSDNFYLDLTRVGSN
ncbi:MAG: hypothetical protein HDS41_02140 [Bacteroides sp.]|nr:hypothetical protein [Bacteroides sp.]